MSSKALRHAACTSWVQLPSSKLLSLFGMLYFPDDISLGWQAQLGLSPGQHAHVVAILQRWKQRMDIAAESAAHIPGGLHACLHQPQVRPGKPPACAITCS